MNATEDALKMQMNVKIAKRCILSTHSIFHLPDESRDT